VRVLMFDDVSWEGRERPWDKNVEWLTWGREKELSGAATTDSDSCSLSVNLIMDDDTGKKKCGKKRNTRGACAADHDSRCLKRGATPESQIPVSQPEIWLCSLAFCLICLGETLPRPTAEAEDLVSTGRAVPRQD
jgi:hypothetical protein